MARKMKNSGIEWIGDIPEDWEVTRIKYIAKADSSGLSLDKLLDDGNFEVYDANSLVGYINHKPVKENYISIIKDGAGIGRTKLMPKNTNVIGTMNYISAKDVNLHYLFYALQVFDFEQYSTGSTIPHIYFKDYGNEYIALPNQEVQKNIVKALNDKVEKIDRLINTVKQEIQTLEDYKKSVITEAVTKGLDKNAAMKDSGIEWIGKIPKESKLSKLKYLVSSNITDGTHQTPEYEDKEKGYPFLSSKDITKGYIDWTDIKYVTKAVHEKLQKETQIRRGDILLAKNGTTGIAAIVDTDKVFDIYVTLALIRSDEKKVIPEYLLYAINSLLSKKQFDEYLLGIGVPNLHLNLIKNTYVIVHDLKYQNQIVDYLNKKCKLIDDAIAGKQKKLESLEEYKKSLIYEYVTGKKEVAEC